MTSWVLSINCWLKLVGVTLRRIALTDMVLHVSQHVRICVIQKGNAT
jgi:hypothetical protein